MGVGLIGRVKQAIVNDVLREVQLELYTKFTKWPRDIAPSGIDACPLPDDQGVMLVLESTGKGVFLGVYPDPQAEPGELRLYSRDSEGTTQAVCWLKNDGTVEINGGGKKAARENDGVHSTSAEDSVFWSWIAAAGSYLAGMGISATIPTTLDGKITGGSETVEVGD